MHGGMVTPFPMHSVIENEGKTFSWHNLVWLSDTDTWDDTQRGCHIIVQIGTRVMWNAIVYSAMIVVMMKIAQKGY